jgi:hypothetical protein
VSLGDGPTTEGSPEQTGCAEKKRKEKKRKTEKRRKRKKEEEKQDEKRESKVKRLIR